VKIYFFFNQDEQTLFVNRLADGIQCRQCIALASLPASIGRYF